MQEPCPVVPARRCPVERRALEVLSLCPQYEQRVTAARALDARTRVARARIRTGQGNVARIHRWVDARSRRTCIVALVPDAHRPGCVWHLPVVAPRVEIPRNESDAKHGG